jgi:hypothetical protein
MYQVPISIAFTVRCVLVKLSAITAGLGRGESPRLYIHGNQQLRVAVMVAKPDWDFFTSAIRADLRPAGSDEPN